jgi:hypothetical protein
LRDCRLFSCKSNKASTDGIILAKTLTHGGIAVLLTIALARKIRRYKRAMGIITKIITITIVAGLCANAFILIIPIQKLLIGFLSQNLLRRTKYRIS